MNDKINQVSTCAAILFYPDIVRINQSFIKKKIVPSDRILLFFMHEQTNLPLIYFDIITVSIFFFAFFNY